MNVHISTNGGFWLIREPGLAELPLPAIRRNLRASAETSTRMPHPIASHQSLDALTWRCIGPHRGGRVVAVAGDPANAMTFYFGACAGGVWKTTDGGTYWDNVSDGYFKTASVGAHRRRRVRPERDLRRHGRDRDPRRRLPRRRRLQVRPTPAAPGGTSACAETQHIGRDPRPPARTPTSSTSPRSATSSARTTSAASSAQGRRQDLGAGALPRRRQRGARRPRIDPHNPRILYAAFWQTPAQLLEASSAAGPAAASSGPPTAATPGRNITRNARACRKGCSGKIGVAVSPARSRAGLGDGRGDGRKRPLPLRRLRRRRWAAGQRRARTCMQRPWYYTHVFADPHDADTVYVLNLQRLAARPTAARPSPRSRRRTATTTTSGSTRTNPQRMIQGNDGGANVSFNGGDTWSTHLQPADRRSSTTSPSTTSSRTASTARSRTTPPSPSPAPLLWGAITLGDCFYRRLRRERLHRRPARRPRTSSSPARSARAPAAAARCSATTTAPTQSRWSTSGPRRARRRAEGPAATASRGPSRSSSRRTTRTCSTPAATTCSARRDEGMSWEEIRPDLSLNDEVDARATPAARSPGRAPAPRCYATTAPRRRIAASQGRDLGRHG